MTDFTDHDARKLIEAVADELSRKEDIEFVVNPQTAFELVSIVQLALRHPAFAENAPPVYQTALRFLEGMRRYFEDCPATTEMIRMGDDPKFDQRQRWRF